MTDIEIIEQIIETKIPEGTSKEVINIIWNTYWYNYLINQFTIC